MLEITPKTNTVLFGHEEAEAYLAQNFDSGKLAHGWIISGPKGMGKATLAYRFARSVLGGSEAIANRIAAGSHADCLVIEPAYNEKKEEFDREINVEQAREIAKFFSLTPGEGQWRVVIVDSADQLNINGANAILKILEEPPPQALLLLISHNPARLLPTIRSRCHVLKLKPLTEDAFRQTMRHLMPDIEPMHLAALGQLSGFSPGVAMELETQGAAESYGQLLELLAGLPTLDPSKVHSFAESWASGQVHTKWPLLLRLVLTVFERVSKQAVGLVLEPLTDQESEILAKLASLHSPAIWSAKWQQAAGQFALVEGRHLDYKQMIIAFLHAIANKEGLQIGNAA